MPETAPEQHDEQDERPPASGRERLLSALFRPTRGQAVVAVLLALVGFAAITQVRTNEVDNTFAGFREQDLINVLDGLAGTTQRAQSEVTRLEATRDDLRSDTSARQAALTQAQTEADTLAILAGVVPVTGPGIRVTIKEIDAAVPVDDLIDMVQELRTAQAESMQINGEVRIVAQTSFEQATGGIVVDGTLLSPPYVVDVIGEPDTLAGAMTFYQGPQQQLERDGAEVGVDELTSLDIESVTDPVQSQYARPDDAQ